MPRARRIDPDVDPIEDEVEETEEEEAAPPRRRRTSAPKEEAAPPVRRRRPVEEDIEEDDDDDEEEEPVTRRRPAAKKAAAKSAEKPVTRRRSEDDDEDSDDDTAVVPISRGRKEIAKNRPVGEGNAAFFRWNEEPQLVKFLDNEPWAYNQHWVTRDGKQSFPCIGKGCPLCSIGVKISQKLVYPILNLTPAGVTSGEFITQTMEIGPQLDETLEGYDKSSKTGPLTRLWWAVSRSEGARSSGRRKKYTYAFTPVKDRDLEEDWEIDLDEAEDAVAAAEIPDATDVIGEWSRAQLQEIADEAMGH